jgi:myosin heavy subunit
MLGLLAGVLHLGNVEFNDVDTAEGEVAEVADAGVLGLAASLLGVEPGLLSNVMCQQEITAMGQVIIKKRDAGAAAYARDAVVKEVFGILFAWLIRSVNVNLGMGPASLPFIGVLDIFGFESFEVNDFEQLLINYTNEVLQSTFNTQVFIAEADLYKAEGIKGDQKGPVTFPDNQECIELIGAKPNGLIPLLDTESKTPKPSDLKFNQAVHKMHAYDPFCPRPHPKEVRETFIVKHFAGPVTYTVGKFKSKTEFVG